MFQAYRPDRGFTFVELALVMGLVVLLAFVLIPQDHLVTFNLEGAVRRVENDFNYCREKAIATNSNCGILFVANGNYTIYQPTPDLPVTDPLTRTSAVINLSQDFKNIHIQNNLQIEFDPWGRPVLGSGITLQIASPTEIASLRVVPNTGVVERL